MRRMSQWVTLPLSIVAVCLAIWALVPGDEPTWVFPVMLCTLFTGQGIRLWQLWHQDDDSAVERGRLRLWLTIWLIGVLLMALALISMLIQ
jgi:phosphatidylglycerophosphate synthase